MNAIELNLFDSLREKVSLGKKLTSREYERLNYLHKKDQHEFAKKECIFNPEEWGIFDKLKDVNN